MNRLIMVKELMPLVKDSDNKHVILITACSGYVIYNDFYSNFSEEVKELNVTLIDVQPDCIVLHVL
jgi:hypothetical protein